MRIIKLATKKEAASGKATQDMLRKLEKIWQKEVVFMPYGKQGRGFYIKN